MGSQGGPRGRLGTHWPHQRPWGGPMGTHGPPRRPWVGPWGPMPWTLWRGPGEPMGGRPLPRRGVPGKPRGGRGIYVKKSNFYKKICTLESYFVRLFIINFWSQCFLLGLNRSDKPVEGLLGTSCSKKGEKERAGRKTAKNGPKTFFSDFDFFGWSC